MYRRSRTRRRAPARSRRTRGASRIAAASAVRGCAAATTFVAVGELEGRVARHGEAMRGGVGEVSFGVCEVRDDEMVVGMGREVATDNACEPATTKGRKERSVNMSRVSNALKPRKHVLPTNAKDATLYTCSGNLQSLYTVVSSLVHELTSCRGSDRKT
jgi:hypothetical protein